MSMKSDSILHNFRAAATTLTGQLQLADRTAMTLASELDAAGLIIQTMLGYLTLAQKLHISIDLESRGIVSDGMSRYHERTAALAMAKQYAGGSAHEQAPRG